MRSRGDDNSLRAGTIPCVSIQGSCESADDPVAPCTTGSDLPRAARGADHRRSAVRPASRRLRRRPEPPGPAGGDRPRRHRASRQFAPPASPGESPSTARSTRPSTRDVPPFGDFVQQEPLEGQPATEKTEVWVFFDDENIYVGARLWETDAGAPVTSEMRRDAQPVQQRPLRGAVRHLLRPPQRLRLLRERAGRDVRLDRRPTSSRATTGTACGTCEGPRRSTAAGRSSSASRSDRSASRTAATSGASTSAAWSAGRTRSPI